MSDEREQQIRDQAYRLWEEEGRPEGRHDAHWHAATSLADEQADAGAQPAEPIEQASPTSEEDAQTQPLTTPPLPIKARRSPAAKRPRARKTPT